MRSVYMVLAGIARRFFEKAGIPIPDFLRRVHRASAGTGFKRSRVDLRDEVAALSRAVERIETMAYVDRIGNRSE